MKKLIPLLLLIHTQAYAECVPKDLTDPDYLRSMGKENLIDLFSKPRDQDTIGWCGGFGPTDSLSFAAGEAISAMDVSLNYFNDTRKASFLQDMTGIGIAAATDLAKEKGYCPESIIPSDQTSSSNLGQQALFNLMKAFQEIANDFNIKGKPADYCVTCAGDQFIKTISPALPNITQDMIREVLVVNKGDALKSVSALMNKLCEGKRKIVKIDYPVWKDTTGKPVTPMLDEALESNAMPSIGMNTSVFAEEEAIPGGHGPHELIVVGRRPGTNGKCEYLIRNSWGKGCSFYQPQIAQKCDPAKGTFWMTSDQLDGNVTNIVHIKNMNTNVANKNSSNGTSNGEGPVLPEDRSANKGQNNNNNTVNNNNGTTVREGNPIPVNPQPIDNSATVREGNPTPVNPGPIDNSATVREANPTPVNPGPIDNSATVREANPTPVNPGPIDNGRYKNPLEAVDFGGLMNKVMGGLETAVSGIWHALSNMFKY